MTADSEVTFPISPVVFPNVQQDTSEAPMMLRFPSFELQRSGDPMRAAALTTYGVQVELLKRQILAELGPEWACMGVEIGGRRV